MALLVQGLRVFVLVERIKLRFGKKDLGGGGIDERVLRELLDVHGRGGLREDPAVGAAIAEAVDARLVGVMEHHEDLDLFFDRARLIGLKDGGLVRIDGGKPREDDAHGDVCRRPDFALISLDLGALEDGLPERVDGVFLLRIHGCSLGAVLF